MSDGIVMQAFTHFSLPASHHFCKLFHTGKQFIKDDCYPIIVMV